MISPRVFKAESIDLAAFLSTAGHPPTIYRDPTGKRAIFEFAENDKLHEAIVAYERGASLPAKRLLNTRSWLWREASRVVREGIATIEASFREAMSNAGIEPPGEIIADGNLHRYTPTSDKPRSNNAWYVLYPDAPAAGAFGCWKRGISQAWSSKPYQTMTAAEKTAHAAKMKAVNLAREAERERVQTECRALCADTWSNAKAANNDHPYLKLKGVDAYGLKGLGDTLLIPLQNLTGTIQGIQFIAPDGSKRFKTGTVKKGHFFMIGKVVDNTIILVEGYATGASVHQATGQAVLVSFDAGNLKPVAELVRAKRPDMKIIIAADDDHANEANPGLTKATEAARIVGGLLAVPVFPGTRGAKDTDLNDLHRLAGEEAVKACIEAAAPATGTPSTTTEATGEQWPEPIPLPEGLPPVKPLDPAMIPAPLRGWLMDIADRMQIPPDFSTAAAVVALGSIIGRGCGIHPKRHDDWLVIPNLWGGVIGRPSLMKTPAIAEAQRHLTRLESEAREEHQTAAGSYVIEKEVLKLTKSAISDKINRRLKKATTLKNCGGNWQLCKRANLHGDATRRKTAPPRNWGSY